jgi:hypothetical protein
MCLNKRVLIGLGAVAAVLLAISPRTLGSAAPLLMFALCPLSMVLMMRGMNGRGARNGIDDAETNKVAQTSTAINAADASSPKMRELEEEVNRLKAQLHIRDQERSN